MYTVKPSKPMKSKSKLKIGLVFDDSLDSSDGVAQYVKTLGGWLSARGHEVCYLVGETRQETWAGGPVYSLAKNQPVHFKGNSLSIPRPAKKQYIRDVLNREKPDILHVMMTYSPFMAQRVIDLAGNDTAVVGTFHIFPAGQLAEFGGRLLKLVYGKKLRRFKRIVSVSRAAQIYSARVFGLQTDIIPNPVDIKRFSLGSQKNNAQPTIVFLGRLVKRKGCAQLIRAFALLLETRPAAHLVVAGDGPQRKQLELLCRKLKIESSVDFLGFIDEHKKPQLLATADIACFPSLYGESFGIVLIEAMAAGSRIVLGGNNPGYASVLGDQPLLLVEPNDTAGFAHRLGTLLMVNQPTKALHAWQLKSVQQYDINIVGAQVLEVYRRAIAPSAKKSHNGEHER
jgi:phosphatidylinositol alpha-mannosyltransferase